jgi:hypothetical protein
MASPSLARLAPAPGAARSAASALLASSRSFVNLAITRMAASCVYSACASSCRLLFSCGGNPPSRVVIISGVPRRAWWHPAGHVDTTAQPSHLPSRGRARFRGVDGLRRLLLCLRQGSAHACSQSSASHPTVDWAGGGCPPAHAARVSPTSSHPIRCGTKPAGRARRWRWVGAASRRRPP